MVKIELTDNQANDVKQWIASVIHDMEVDEELVSENDPFLMSGLRQIVACLEAPRPKPPNGPFKLVNRTPWQRYGVGGDPK